MLFWCVMTFLLVRMIVSPESSGLLDVPVYHVARMVFLGGQTSELSIYQNSRTAGSFSLRPEQPAPGGGRTLQFSGNLALELPFIARQRVVWQGTLKMDRQLHLGACQGTFSVRDSPNSIQLEYAPREQVMRYQIKSEDGASSASFPAQRRGGVERLARAGGG